MGKEYRCKQRVDRQTSTAGHKGGHDDGQYPIILLFQRSGRHHARNVTAKTDNQRDKGLSGKADRLHHAIDNKGGACHVT